MWGQELADSYTRVSDLSRAGLITEPEAARLTTLGERFQVRVTPYYAGLMSRSPDCPIRQQAIPSLGEEDPALPEWAQAWSQKIYGRREPWTADAIGDLDRLAAPRLTHRYGNRAILHVSSLCAVFCRFCFRKEHLNEREARLYDGSFDPAFDYLRAHPEVRELILTGGDPLSMTDAAIDRLLGKVATCSNIKTLRIHSRMAVTLPSRFTPELARVLSGPGSELSVALVSHFNHPREWTSQAREALALMRRAGLSLFNQNVLMARVNDSVDVLAELYQGLYEAGVVPMYLHHPDWTPGTFQFRVSVEHGQRIARGLRGRLPGAAVPHYVVDLPGGVGKSHLLDPEVRKLEEHRIEGALGGAVYELSLPQTLQGSGRQLYLDLFSLHREPLLKSHLR